jgi:hypothetical protein
LPSIAEIVNAELLTLGIVESAVLDGRVEVDHSKNSATSEGDLPDIRKAAIAQTAVVLNGLSFAVA